MQSLVGTYVEKCDAHVVDIERLAISDLAQDDCIAHSRHNLGGYHDVAHRLESMTHLAVAVDSERAVVFTLVEQRRDFAYEPYHAHYMVGMHMGDEEVMNLRIVDASTIELAEDTVAATCIHHQMPCLRFKVETGVVAPSAHSAPRA